MGKVAAGAGFLLLFPLLLSGDTVTLPAAASLPAGSAASPFFSDVRVFNTSYLSAVSVTAAYRCFLGACPAAAPQVSFTLAPRESKPFDDMVASAFAAPSTAGAVEFTSAEDSVRVTSRLYSPAPGGGTNGMFVPGMTMAQTYSVSVLMGLANGPFRTNVGVYNGNDRTVTATIRLYDASTVLGMRTVTLGPRSGTQVNRIFDAVGQAGRTTTNAVAVVESSDSAPLFTYAAVIDNASSDSSFVAGAEDERAPAPQTITVNVKAWDFSPGGPNSPPLVLNVGTTYVLVFHNVDLPGTPSPRHGFSGISELGLSGTEDISPGHDVTLAPFTPQPFQRGTYPFICTQNDCGGDPEQHRGMQGSIIVQ